MVNLRNNCRTLPRHRSGSARLRSGFTLLELLVVVGIILLLAAMTAAAVNLNTNTDKVRGASRQIQTYLAGARDRAIYGKAPRGVRFLLDPTNNRTVSSLVYIQETEPWSQGAIQLERLDLNNDGTADESLLSVANPSALIVRGFDNDPINTGLMPTSWVDLYNNGILYDGAIIEINGNQYTVTTELLQYATAVGVTPYYPPRLHLTTAFNEAANNTLGNADIRAFVPPNSNATKYKLSLPPSVMPNANPVLLPKGAVVHLDRCTTPGNVDANPSFRGDKLPSVWKRIPIAGQPASTDPSGFDYTTQMDIMFSPRGIVMGSGAQRGIIHLYVGEQKDADRDRLIYWPTNAVSTPEYGALADNYERGDKLILSVFTRTGSVSSHPVHPTDTFRFAETGEVAGK